MQNRLYSINYGYNWGSSLLLSAILCATCFLLVSPVDADSRLNKNKYSQVRVLRSNTLSTQPAQRTLVGLHIKMQKGWKTYWRKPGDSGIPPHFDWKESENLKSAKVLWPAPIRMKDPYGSSIGYKSEVVFPVWLEAEDPDKPIHIKLTFGYGACLDICIPEERKLSFKVPGGSATSIKDHRLLMQFRNRVPVTAKLNEKNKSVPVLNTIKSTLNGKSPHLALKVTFPDGAKKSDIFVEVSEGFFVASPKEVKGNNKEKIYHIDLTKGDKISDLIGKTITLTLVSDLGQSETKWVMK